MTTITIGQVTATPARTLSDRSAFTLLEVMVAIVLTSVVALVAYGAAQVSVESQARLDTSLRSVRSDRALRQTLLDLLHNVRAPRQHGDTSLIVTGDTLWFVAAGAAPLDPDSDWLVRLRPGAGGLEFEATALGRAPPTRVGFRVPRVTRWDLSLLAAGDSNWRREWPQAAVLPRAIALRLSGDEVSLAPPLLVTLASPLPQGWTDDDLTAQ